jgi:hypothetical protein
MHLTLKTSDGDDTNFGKKSTDGECDVSKSVDVVR